MSNERPVTVADLKPYQPFGIPVLKLLGMLALLSCFVTIAYEVLF